MKCTLELCPMFNLEAENGNNCDYFGDPAECELFKWVIRLETKTDKILEELNEQITAQ